MFIVDMAMGKYYIPSGPSQNLPKTGYDSTWAYGQNRSGVLNDEVIVYRESQVNIRYLMELKP